MPTTLEYTFSFPKPEQHQVHMTLVFTINTQQRQTGVRLQLPAWIPGSYLIRDFARHIMQIRATATDTGEAIALEKMDQQTWLIPPLALRTTQRVSINYTVYAWDDSVRGAFVDAERAFLNPACLCLQVLGQAHSPCTVSIVLPTHPHYQSAQVITGLTQTQGLHTFSAQNYAELIDCPISISQSQLASFSVNGILHRVCLTGASQRVDLNRIVQDMQAICATQQNFWGSAPFADYTFLIHASADGYGGLEHHNSTALICKQQDLPKKGENSSTKTPDYIKFLGLVSHEYFHAWNVKTLKPIGFVDYDLTQPIDSSELWFYEGFTAYYDDLMLLRSGMISAEIYLDLLAQSLSQVSRSHGEKIQTLAAAGMEAWTKYYRADENAVNSLVSYYTKGAALALCIDLSLRLESAHTFSLDHCMQNLWAEFKTGQGIPKQQLEATFCLSPSLSALLEQGLRSTTPLPVSALLEQIGIQTQSRATQSSQDKGGWISNPSERIDIGAHHSAQAIGIKLLYVKNHSAAEEAGLCAQDLLIALNGEQIQQNWDVLLQSYAAGEKLSLHYFRQQQLRETQLTLRAAEQTTCGLRIQEDASDFLKNTWLAATE